MLELADKEFIQIRNDLLKYEEEVEDQIEKNPALVTLDNLSLTSFIKTNEIVRGMDLEIANICSAQIKDKDGDEERAVDRLYYFNIETISDLEKNLIQHKDKTIKFAKKWLSGSKYSTLKSGISIFYLLYVLLAMTKKAEDIERYLEHFRMGSLDRSTSEIAQKIIETYNSL